jgi:hypothetical protein
MTFCPSCLNQRRPEGHNQDRNESEQAATSVINEDLEVIVVGMVLYGGKRTLAVDARGSPVLSFPGGIRSLESARAKAQKRVLGEVRHDDFPDVDAPPQRRC